ncbi:MAG: hypothetical protein V1783_08940 [Bacteroidota bacterium]
MEQNSRKELNELFERVSSLEKRISVFEGKLVNPDDLKQATRVEAVVLDTDSSSHEESEETFLEASIGEYGLAWFGNIILLFGGIFLHSFVQSKAPPLYSALIGYAFAASMLLFAGKIRNSFSYLSSVFNLFAKILVFYTTVKLHFFTSNPLFENKFIAISFLLTPVLFQIYQSFKLRSEKHALLGLIFISITAIISNETHLLLSMLTLTVAGSVFFLFKFRWTKTLLYTLFLVYFSFLVWLLGNPIMNLSFKAVSESHYSEYYLFVIATLFSLVFLVKQKDIIQKNSLLMVLILNGLGFSFLITLLTLLFFSGNYQLLFALLSAFCIIYSVFLKTFSDWKYSPALYAVYGFVAISITFYGILKFPMVFLALTLQSLLVLSMALWFRSKIIVVLNTLMFIALVAAYFSFFGQANIINFSFPIIAAISARIINWQHNRLTLNSQFIRNIYLFILFFTMLYALKKAFPSDYVTLSWSITAMVYFGLSIVLTLVKYRYLAIATLVAASINLFFVDFATINVVYRIIAFMVLAVISIGISIYYVDKLRTKSLEREDRN